MALARSLRRLLGEGPHNTDGYRLGLLVAWERAYLDAVLLPAWRRDPGTGSRPVPPACDRCFGR